MIPSPQLPDNLVALLMQYLGSLAPRDRDMFTALRDRDLAFEADRIFSHWLGSRHAAS